MTMRLRVTTEKPSLYTYEVTINGRTKTYTASDMELAEEGKYYLYFRGVKATEFNDEVVAVIKKDGEQISQTLYYSVNTYIQKNQNSTDKELAELVQAIYNYGESAKLFAD